METLQETVKARYKNYLATACLPFQRSSSPSPTNSIVKLPKPVPLEDLDVSYRVYCSEDAAKNEDGFLLVAKGRAPYSQIPLYIAYATFHHTRRDACTGRLVYHCYL